MMKNRVKISEGTVPGGEDLKRWLAKVGYERVQEIEDPELEILTALISYTANVATGTGTFFIIFAILFPLIFYFRHAAFNSSYVFSSQYTA